MDLRYQVIICFLSLSLGGQAQGKGRDYSRATDSLSALVSTYVDSLIQYRRQQDSTDVVYGGSERQATSDIRYYRLFTPLTFYRGIAHRQFLLSEKETDAELLIDRSLLSVYLSRPDLVQNTQSQLDRIGPALSLQGTSIRPGIVENASPMPEEPHGTQVDLLLKRPNFWKFSGDAGLQAFQNYISGNWYQGGESNYSFLTWINLHADYNNKQKVKWENTLEIKLGMQSSRSDKLHTLKTNTDLLRYTGKVGLQATKKWYYTLKVETQTQLMRSYRSNDPKVYSDFMSPLKANVSIGMDYNVNWLKNRLTGSVHLAPLSYDFKYVDRKDLLASNGIPESRHTNDDFGSLFTIDLNWKLVETINWKMRMKGYTSYHRVEYEWENTISLRVTKYLSSSIFIYPRFDDSRKRDDHHGYWMFKEYVSLGVNYSF